jgi:4a-hydroxytetrahydrobiopterin dehydratase
MIMKTSKPSILTKKHCEPCEGGIAPLSDQEVHNLLNQLSREWKILDNQLEKTYLFPDFKHALAFTLKVGELAEQEGHHPDIFLSWGKVKIFTSTHAIKGLSTNDFILAAKCDNLM